MVKKPNGFAHLGLIILIFGVMAIVGFAGFKVINAKSNSNAWNFNGGKWVAKGTAPACPDPILQSPVDVSKVTSVLYPGQYRSGNYKVHGGFRVDNATDNNAVVKIPIDSTLLRGSRYIEQGKVQNLLVFMAPCGIMYRFDHLLTLTPKFQAAVNTSLPQPKVNYSNLYEFKPKLDVQTGEVVATAVGFVKNHNVSFDFGVEDLRQPNAASKRPDYIAAHAHDNSLEEVNYGVCWFDYLPAKDAAFLRTLPGGDHSSGKNSDYCE